MSILWCGGEDIDFSTSIVSSWMATGYRSGYSRLAASLGTAGLLRSPAVTPFTSVWLSFQLGLNATSANGRTGGLGKSGTNAMLGIGTGTTATKIALIKYDGTTRTVLAEESGSSLAALNKIDIHMENYGANATVTVYVNGTQVISYTGDVTVLSQTSLDQVYINNAQNGVYVSEFILADEDTRLMSLVTLAPSAAGDASEWTNGYANIDESTKDDADTIYTSTANQNFQCNLTGMPAGDFICKGVKVAARATDGVGGIGIQLGVKTNSQLDLGNAVTLGGVWQTVEKLYQQNPITSNRFTPAEIEALQLAVKSIAV